ncbi:MAG: TetR/AcrR family transcriptional regulator, ethionamide resistance regulator [Thermoleophilaceae bacterium]|jgi:AcrR family transcriptional regulator|nr:TetR/AcrR family transcriptional regulator, ethionamide resistance regulator [Thermoleophilaceae bacterium]
MVSPRTVSTANTSPQRTKLRQAPEETRGQIIQAALAFLRENSYREISVELLMTQTGHSRTVFYKHFDDVPSLMLALIQEVGTELLDVAKEWAQTERVSADEARARLALFVDFYVRNGPLVRAVSEAAPYDETVEEAYSALVEGFIAMTTRAIDSRVNSGALDKLDAPEIARALVRMLNGYLGDSLGHTDGTDPDRVLQTVSTIWTRTLFPGES